MAKTNHKVIETPYDFPTIEQRIIYANAKLVVVRVSLCWGTYVHMHTDYQLN